MYKHTPGPWKACRSNEEFAGVLFERESGEDLYPIVRIVSKSETIVAAHDLFKFDEDNARLLAAAPDLLEALCALLDMPEFDGTKYRSRIRLNIRKRACDAIAKATEAM